MNRWVMMTGALLLPAMMARAEPVVARVGSVAPDGTPWAEWVDNVKKRMEKEANGQLKMKLYLAGKLGGEKEMVEDVKRGTLQMFGGSVGALAAQHVPELNVFELPYLFESDAETNHVLNAVRPRVKKLLEQRGFIMSMWAENGWHGYGVKGKCLKGPDDMKGLKMRSQESTIHLETYRAFGASPVEMAVPEVLSALQTGTVDGYSNTPLFSFATSWYSGITHFTYTKHIYQPALMVISKKWFESLTPALQKILIDPKEEESGFQQVRALTEPLLDNFTAAKVTVCRLTPAQTKAFAAKARPVWDSFGKTNAANKAMLDAVLAAKASFSQKK